MYGLVRPQIAIPVHGTARHLMAHAGLAEGCQVGQTLIPDSGNVISLPTAADRMQQRQASLTTSAGALTHEKGQIIEVQSDMMRAMPADAVERGGNSQCG